MITTTLNVTNQTRRLGSRISTGVYDDGELETLLSETADSVPAQGREAQTLSSELLARILAGEFASSGAKREDDGKGNANDQPH